MSRTRAEAIAQHIAARITRNTRKQWRTLHADALQEISMKDNLGNTDGAVKVNRSQGSPADGKAAGNAGELGSGVTSGMAAKQNSELRPVMVKQTDYKTLAGSNPGDHRANAAPAVLPPQPAVRAENNDSEGA